MRKLLHFLLVMLLFELNAQAQTIITGTITDNSNGEQLPGATIIEKGTSNGTVTDVDGKFSLKVSTPEATLVVTYVGYTSEEIALKGQTNLDIKLKNDVLKLDDVVVVGYGTQKKSVVTGAIAKVDQDILEKSRVTRVEQALQGQTAGVIIINNSGQPGDNLTVRIRGVGTVNNADPLFIVDGLPLEQNSLDYLNTSDIQSIEVLKDASSTAIYGTRGANGVVMITTKQGRKDEELKISYDMYYGVQNPWRKVEMLNAKQYIDLMNEAAKSDKLTPVFSQAAIDTLRWDTDWQDKIYYYNAPKQNHSISVIGGTKTSTYSSSLSYLSQDGIAAKGQSKFDRIAFRLNTSHEIGKLNIGTNINLAQTKKSGINPNDEFSAYALVQVLNTPPVMPVKYDNGNWATPKDFKLGFTDITNPIAMLSYLNQKSWNDKVVGGLYAELQVFKGLFLKSHFTTEVDYQTNQSYTPKYFLDDNHKSDVNSVGKAINMNATWNLDNTIRYTNNFRGHNFTTIAGISYLKSWSEDMSASTSNVIFDDMEHAYLSNGQNANGVPAGGYKESRLASTFVRINYDYNEKYLFEFVIRRDGSTRFGADYRYGIFPSVSAGWVISKEDFFPKQSLLNYAKLRLGWGQNGNDKIGDWQFTSVMASNQYANIYYFGVNKDTYFGIQPSKIPNPKVHWEKSEQTNIGVNLGFLNNKLTLNIDLYDKRTKDWLLPPMKMLLQGNDVAYENMGEVANKGIEVELGFKHKIADFSYSASIIAGSNKSEVIAIQNENSSYTGGGTLSQGGELLRAEPGQPLGYFWGYKIKGIFQTQEEVDNYKNSKGKKIQPMAKPGDFIWVDLDTNGIINDDDRTNIGSPYPKFTCGVNLSFEWKGIDLYMFWYTALGQSVFFAERKYDQKKVNYSVYEYNNRWTEENTNNEYARITLNDYNGNYKRPSEALVKDASYLRLKNLTCGYTIPRSITKTVKIDKFRLYVSFENLLTFTKYPGTDVEIGGGPLEIGIDKGVYPQSKTVLFGANIVF